MMKQAHTKTIDTQGLQKVLTSLAIAAGLAGWAVMARPDTSVATSTSVAPVVASAPQVAAQIATSGLRVVTAPQAGLRVVTAAPAPVTSTSSSR